ncbi:MAG: DotH/IcmK family type IV secretion protein [Pseudomonadota bacterium]
MNRPLFKWHHGLHCIYFLVGILVLSGLLCATAKAAANPNTQNQVASTGTTSSESSGDANNESVSVQALNKAAFGSMTQTMLPMTPLQIQRLRQLFNQTQAAAVTTPGTPPRPTISSQYVKLEPGATPTVIRLAQGYVTTVAFLDATGQPWPVDNYDIGNPQSFNIQWDKKSNLLMIQATALYSVGNLAVQLRGLPTPVMVTLVSGQKAVDYRIDLRIPGNGPNAKALLGRSLPESADPTLLNILEGVAPKGSSALKISGGPAQAWYGSNHLYLRTRLTLISPAWIATMSSPDGMKAYEMPKTPLILGFQDGQSIQLKVEGF